MATFMSLAGVNWLISMNSAGLLYIMRNLCNIKKNPFAYVLNLMVVPDNSIMTIKSSYGS